MATEKVDTEIWNEIMEFSPLYLDCVKNGIGYYELESFYYHFKQHNKVSRARWLLRYYERQRNRYLEQGIALPLSLSGDDWQQRMWSEMVPGEPFPEHPWIDWRPYLGIESNEIEQSIPSILSEPQDTPQTTKEEISEGEPPQSKENVDRAGNPFETDGFGQVLGEPEEPKGLGNRRR